MLHYIWKRQVRNSLLEIKENNWYFRLELAIKLKITKLFEFLNFRRRARCDLGKGGPVFKDNIAMNLCDKYFYVEIYYERKIYQNKELLNNIWIHLRQIEV
jgi:hypothetical protein